MALSGKTSGHWAHLSLPARHCPRAARGDPIGRESSKSPYSMEMVTFEEDQGAYDQFDAQGFIKLNALRLRLGASAGRRGGAL